MNAFNTPQDVSESPQCKGAFLPLLLLEISLALVLIFQVSMQVPQRNLLQSILKQNAKGVEQSQQVQADLIKLISEFNEVAPEEAKTVFAKYGIQLNGAPTPAPAAK
ncbi:MAG: hypothetical protein WCO68_05370 [Verrucomicrobiota bacterium]